MRSLDLLREAGDVDVETERRATAIVRRILATVYRYMMTGSEPDRERVLLASVEGDSHTLGLQMAHDQLMAEGFRATLVSDLSPERLADTIESQSPDVFVIGGTSASVAPAMRRLFEEIREHYPELPVLARRSGRDARPARPLARDRRSSASSSACPRSRSCSAASAARPRSRAPDRACARDGPARQRSPAASIDLRSGLRRDSSVGRAHD